MHSPNSPVASSLLNPFVGFFFGKISLSPSQVQKRGQKRGQKRAQMRGLTRAMTAAAVALVLISALKVNAAQNIEFPEEELATESVLPVFDQPVSVKNRAVLMTGRFEGEIMGGYSLTEAFFNPVSYGASVTYHISETSGINIFGLSYAGGLSDKGKALNGHVENSSINANLQYGPQNKYLLLANYEFSAYYGKISITKDYVMNLNLYGLAGLGGLAIGDGTVPVLSLGIGQKYYFTKNFSLRADLRFLFYQGPNILSARLDLPTIKSTQPNSYFSNKFFADGLMTVGVDYMLP